MRSAAAWKMRSLPAAVGIFLENIRINCGWKFPIGERDNLDNLLLSFSDILTFLSTAASVHCVNWLQQLFARLAEGRKDGRVPFCPDGARPYHPIPATTKLSSLPAGTVGQPLLPSDMFLSHCDSRTTWFRAESLTQRLWAIWPATGVLHCPVDALRLGSETVHSIMAAGQRTLVVVKSVLPDKETSCCDLLAVVTRPWASPSRLWQGRSSQPQQRRT